MTTAKEIFDSVAALAIRQVGRAATYMPKVGNPVSNCSVDITIEGDSQPIEYSQGVSEGNTILEYILSETGGEADIGGKFTLEDDGTVYIIKQHFENDGRTAKAIIKIAD